MVEAKKESYSMLVQPETHIFYNHIDREGTSNAERDTLKGPFKKNVVFQ